MTKLALDTTLTDLQDRPILDGEPKYKRNADGSPVFDQATSEPVVLEQPKEFTLRAACLRALSAALEGDQKASAEDKLKLFAVATKIASGEDHDYSAEQVVLLKKRIAEAYGFLIVGRCYALLDPVKEDK